MVREALSLGALGYVDKTHTSTDLLPAIEAVLRAEQFVSESLESSGRTDAPRRHEVQFYSCDSGLLESFARVLATALESGGAAIVLATKSHREGLVQRLQAEGFAVDVAMRQGTYISRDAADTLSTMMVNGVPDGARFLEGLTGVIASAAKAKCVGLLRAREYQCHDSTRKGWQRSGQNTQCRYPVCVSVRRFSWRERTSGVPEHLSRAHSRLLPLRTVPARMPVATDAREPKGGIGPSAREKPLQEAWCHIRRLQDPLDRACREVRSCDPAMPRGYPRNKS